MNKIAPQAPFQAFVSNAGDLETLKSFASSQTWPDDCVVQGNIATAATHLKDHPSPRLLLVEAPSTAGEAMSQLGALAEVCDPDSKHCCYGYTWRRWSDDGIDQSGCGNR